MGYAKRWRKRRKLTPPRKHESPEGLDRNQRGHRRGREQVGRRFVCNYAHAASKGRGAAQVGACEKVLVRGVSGRGGTTIAVHGAECGRPTKHGAHGGLRDNAPMFPPKVLAGESEESVHGGLGLGGAGKEGRGGSQKWYPQKWCASPTAVGSGSTRRPQRRTYSGHSGGVCCHQQCMNGHIGCGGTK